MKPENVIPTDALYTSLKALCPDKVPGLAELSQDLAWDPRFNDEDRDVCNYGAGVMTLLDRVIDGTNMPTGDLSAYVICHRLREAEKDGNIAFAARNFPHIVEKIIAGSTQIWVANSLDDAVRSIIQSYRSFIVEYDQNPGPYGPYDPLGIILNRLAKDGKKASPEQYVLEHAGLHFGSVQDCQRWHMRSGWFVSWRITNMYDALEACPRPKLATVEETKK